MKKLLLLLLLVLVWGGMSVFAKDTLYYADACPHCQKIVKYVQDNHLTEKFDLELKEVRSDKQNLKDFVASLDKHHLDPEDTYLPFLSIDEGEYCEYMEWENAIANYYASKLDLDQVCLGGVCEDLQCDSDVTCDEHFSCRASTILASDKEESFLGQRLKFLWVLLPAALADSINPCAFAVIILLLFSILALERNHKRAIWAWLLFSLAVFISYFLMGLGIFSLLASFQVEAIATIKWIVAWLAILIALFNLKDFIRYGKWFLMEVPLSWRPKMQKIIQSVTSPAWAFVIGLVVSLFLLPCTSGPYFVVLGYLASEASKLQAWGYFYLFLYNLIFVLPMLALVLVIGLGWKSVSRGVGNYEEKIQETYPWYRGFVDVFDGWISVVWWIGLRFSLC